MLFILQVLIQITIMDRNGPVNKTGALNNRYLSIDIIKKSSKLALRNPNSSKKHCPKDLACYHCCQCWIIHKDQYEKRVEIFQTKIIDLIKENSLLKSCVQRLTKELISLRVKIRKNHDIQDIKQDLLKQIKKQVEQDNFLKTLIQNQKMANLSQQIQQKLSEVKVLSDRNSQISQQLQEQRKGCKEKNQQLQKYSEQIERQIQQQRKLVSINRQKQDQIKQAKQAIISLQKALHSKSQSINSMKSTIDQSDRLMNKHMQQITQKDFERNKITLESTHKSQLIQNIQRLNVQKSQNIELLSRENNKLDDLVFSLRDELYQTDKHKNILKLALNQSQFLVRQKSMSLENLKQDINLLKYTL